MKSKNPFNISTILIIGVPLLLVALVAGSRLGEKTPKNLEVFAQCLKDKNVTMYGAAWCPHCQAEKKRFKGAFKYIKYVECPDNVALCTQKGIEGYPTWELGDGTKLAGEQTKNWAKFSSDTGCPLSFE